MHSLKEFRQLAKDRMKKRKHNSCDWATHRCSFCGYETRINSKSIEPKCQICQRKGTLELINERNHAN